LLWHFSPGDKIENCSAQLLAVCWIVRVEFKVHRLCDGVSVGNALLLGMKRFGDVEIDITEVKGGE